MDEVLAEENKDAESDGDELLTEEEMAQFRARLKAKKGKQEPDIRSRQHG